MAGRYDPLKSKPPLAYAGMRIGLLGGSFNPAHEGHRHISALALVRLGLDQVWWLVTPGNPLKSRADLPSLAERMTAARRVARHPRIKVTGFEVGLPTSYTVNTVKYLCRRYPGVRFVWIMGGDNLAQFHRWRNWRALFALLPVLVMDRPTARLPALASPAAQTFARARIATGDVSALPWLTPPAWGYLTIPLSAISSTAIRTARSALATGGL